MARCFWLGPGYNVSITRADAMLRRLKQSRLDNSRDAVIADLASIDLLIVDDFALEPMSRDGVATHPRLALAP